MLLVSGLSWRCALSNHLFQTIGFTGIGKKILSGVLDVEEREGEFAVRVRRMDDTGPALEYMKI